MTVTHPETDVLHDLDWTPACESSEALCFSAHTLPASWYFSSRSTCGCRRLEFLICRACADEARREILSAVPLVCLRCDTSWGMGALRDFVILEPLP